MMANRSGNSPVSSPTSQVLEHPMRLAINLWWDFPTMANDNPALEFLATTRIGEKGQLTVPKEFRSELGLGVGAPFAVLRLGDGLILLPEQQRFEQLCEQISSKLAAAGLTPKDALAPLN